MLSAEIAQGVVKVKVMDIFSGKANMSKFQKHFGSFRKGIFFKKKESAPKGSKFFFIIVNTFKKGACVQVSKQEVTKNASLVKLQENLLSVFSPFNAFYLHFNPL